YSKNGDELPADSWQRSSVYFYGYNDSLFARRVHDILTALTFIRNHETWKVKTVGLAGEPGTGHWVAAARAVAGADIDRAVADTGGFRFGKLASDWDADFLPGAEKYGDLAGFLALSAPESLLLIDGDEALSDTVKKNYEATGNGSALTVGGDALDYLAE
ncbi:MAG: hypothetical protein KDN19_19255, partial [Verrucomicrobiae bacterium]|nr:hypothetical protein [Verrucomicrobiae bacterium]